MININDIIKFAIEKNASDIHLVSNRKPTIRVMRDLLEIEESETLQDSDMYEIYDYFIRGNLDRDEMYKKSKQLDLSYEYEDTRLRLNISSSDDVPVFTLRIIKNNLPKFSDLGVPDIVRRMMYQPQGLILVTGKTNSGKTTTLNALINEVNQNENKKILTLEKPIEFKHKSNKCLIVQKEVGQGRDVLNFRDGVKNSLREDCDILVIRRDKR